MCYAYMNKHINGKHHKNQVLVNNSLKPEQYNKKVYMHYFKAALCPFICKFFSKSTYFYYIVMTYE